MSRELPHTKLLNAAAKEVLGPLALRRKGRSRVWLDDQGWWLGVVEFQPSSWSRGSYLNVGVGWLWSGVGSGRTEFGGTIGWSFSLDDGYTGRVLLPNGRQFIEYESDEQFVPLAREMASVAAERVRQQRELLRTPADAAAALLSGVDISAGRDTAIALALVGRRDEALSALDRAEARTREREGTDRWTPSDDAQLEQDRRVRDLIVTDDIRSAACDVVRARRRALALPEDVALPF